jgi:L-2,4-diaminobutyrate decarboxylase
MNHYFITSDKDSKKELSSVLNETSKAIQEVFSDDKAYSGPTPYELRKLICQKSILPQKGLGWDAVFKSLKEKVLPNLLKTSSTDYMPHLHSPALIETIASELIISTFNQSMDSWDQSPAATEIEVDVINHLCRLYGYDKKSDGVFTSGGSQSNQTAIILARDWFCNKVLCWDVQKSGLPENFSKLRMYTSEISHFSMEKSAHILGLGYNSVVKVPVTPQKKMDITTLEKLIEQDKKAGNIPFLVVGTVGTTDFGSIDNIKEIARIAKENNMWFHADAAYGSGLILSQKYASRIDGINLCDSITVDFHKMFLMPISCSAVLIKEARDFDSLTIHADYLNREEDEEDGYINLVDKSLQTTRRFDALKVWVSFQVRGKDGWNNIINTCVENAAYLYEKIAQNPDFEVITKPEISSVVFRYKGKKDSDEINKTVRRKLLHEHGIVVGQTVSDGNVCLKFTLLNPLMTHQKLDELLELILKLSEKR